MRITTKSKYGIRMLVEIASQSEGRAAPLKSIAQKLNISEKYLEQIVIPLVKAGYVKSVRGANGGYIMAAPAEEITAKMVILALEGETSQRACIGEVGGCPREKSCAVIELWKEINQAVSEITTRTTVADLVLHKKRKCERYGILDELIEMKDNKSACSE